MVAVVHRQEIGGANHADRAGCPADSGPRIDPRVALDVGDPDLARAEALCGPLAVLAAALQQLADVLDGTSDEQYVQKPVGVIASSLGGHVRHCLDHFAALCQGAETGLIDYDARERGTAVEASRTAAVDAIAGLRDRLTRLDAVMSARTVRVRSVIDADGTAIETTSSLGRELVFVLSHTIHHNALVSAMCRTLGIALPARFGYAPSTVAHLDRAACAR